ncbi:MAG TPA: PAS domain S-box protein, partial [Syntrophomonas wolfei]|nr:PAS domain S-box protein [Syntrophomonas wolfei]
KLLYEKEIARLDQLNIVGEMAAVIGHEIRNPMTTVRGFLQMLSGKEDCAKYKDYYGIMIEELDRANSIVAEFLSLTKDRIVDLKDHNLNAILEA